MFFLGKSARNIDVVCVFRTPMITFFRYCKPCFRVIMEKRIFKKIGKTYFCTDNNFIASLLKELGVETPRMEFL